MGIELPILFHTDQTTTFKEVGIDYELSECEVRKMLFININAVSKYLDGGKWYSQIHSNGDSFICTYTYDKVIELLKQ